MTAHLWWDVYVTKTYDANNVFGASAIEMASTVSGADLVPGNTITASSGSSPGNVGDSNNATMWSSDSAGGPHRIIVQFASPVDIVQVRYRSRNDDGGAQSPRDIQVRYSDDGSTFFPRMAYTSLPLTAQSTYLFLTYNATAAALGAMRLNAAIGGQAGAVSLGAMRMDALVSGYNTRLSLAEMRLNALEGGYNNRLSLGEVRMNVLISLTPFTAPEIY